jgi:hypothetical protein
MRTTFALVVMFIAASFFVDILGLMFLPNFLRRPKIKRNQNPEIKRNPKPDNEVLATMLKDMESLGLIKLKSGEGASRGKRQAKHQNDTSKKTA